MRREEKHSCDRKKKKKKVGWEVFISIDRPAFRGLFSLDGTECRDTTL
jgi:hypothetical protein